MIASHAFLIGADIWIAQISLWLNAMLPPALPHALWLALDSPKNRAGSARALRMMSARAKRKAPARARF